MSRFTDFVEAVRVELADPTVDFVTGKAKEGQHGQRRRVHWYRETGTIVAPQQAGGRMVEDDANGSRQPAVWLRQETILVRIFSENEDTAETLLDNLIVAIDHVRPNGAASWEDYQWQENEIAQRTPLIHLRFSIPLPVVDEIKGLTIITDENLEGVLDIPPVPS